MCQTASGRQVTNSFMFTVPCQHFANSDLKKVIYINKTDLLTSYMNKLLDGAFLTLRLSETRIIQWL